MTRSPLQESVSLASCLASSPRKAKILASLTPSEKAALEYAWEVWARPKQLRPRGSWRTWLILAGRGFGKTRTGAETVRQWVEEAGPRSNLRIALIGATAADVRDTMVEGESGLLACSPPWNRPRYYPSKRRVVWKNGAQALCLTAEEPDRLRGPQFHKGWADEVAAWSDEGAWDQFQLGLRLGRNPQAVVTTTPRPKPIVRKLLKDLTTVTTRGSTYENKANLARAFLKEIVTKYEGTRLGRQELYAELLEDVPGALWTINRIDALRVNAFPELLRIVVAIDPSVTSNASSCEAGIIVAGVDAGDRLDELSHGYVLEDVSRRDSPHGWASAAVDALKRWGADRIVAEVNNGGDLVETVIRTVDPNVPYSAVRASRGKRTRAEPVAALDEQGRIHHVGAWPELEDQLTTWDASSGAPSPDRLDARVWAFTELMLGGVGGAYTSSITYSDR